MFYVNKYFVITPYTQPRRFDTGPFISNRFGYSRNLKMGMVVADNFWQKKLYIHIYIRTYEIVTYIWILTNK